MRSPLLAHAPRAALCLTLLGTVSLGACGGGGGDAPTQPAPTPVPTLAVAAAAAPVAVRAGQQGTTTVTVTRTGSFGGAVALTADVPTGATGVTAAFEPATVPGGGTQTTLTLATTAATPAGDYTVVVTGSGAGVANAQTAVTLRVGATQAIAIGVSQPALSITTGGSGTADVTITRPGGFAGDVALAAEGLPAGVTAAFAPAVLTGTTVTSTLTLSASAQAAAAGPATVTLRATGAGGGATVALPVTVAAKAAAAPTAGGTTTRLAFCATDAPIWVGVQNGDGAWTRPPEVAPQQFDLTIGARGGVAVVRRDPTGDGSSYTIDLTYLAGAELPAFGQRQAGCDAPTIGAKTVNGSVAGVGASGAIVTLGSSLAFVGSAPPNFDLQQVADGALTLVATRNTNTGHGIGAADRVILRRNVDAADGATLPVLDFDGPEAFAPATANLTLVDVGSDVPSLGVSFYTGRFGGAPFAFDAEASPLRYAGVPGDRLAAGELHLLTASAESDAGQAPSGRLFFAFFRDVVDRTVAFGPALSPVTVTSAAAVPYLRPRVQFAGQADYGALVTVDLAQEPSTAGNRRRVSITRTAAYAGGTVPAAWEIAAPDLSTADGFNAQWALQNGVATGWRVAAYGGSVLTLLGGTPGDGTTFRGATRDGTLGGAGLAAWRGSRAAASRTPEAAARARLERLRRLSPYRR